MPSAGAQAYSGGLEVVPLFRGAGSPSNTMSPEPRQLPPCQVTSWSLVDPAVWPQQTWAEIWGCAPLGGGGPI